MLRAKRAPRVFQRDSFLRREGIAGRVDVSPAAAVSSCMPCCSCPVFAVILPIITLPFISSAVYDRPHVGGACEGLPIARPIPGVGGRRRGSSDWDADEDACCSAVVEGPFTCCVVDEGNRGEGVGKLNVSPPALISIVSPITLRCDGRSRLRPPTAAAGRVISNFGCGCGAAAFVVIVVGGGGRGENASPPAPAVLGRSILTPALRASLADFERPKIEPRRSKREARRSCFQVGSATLSSGAAVGGGCGW